MVSPPPSLMYLNGIALTYVLTFSPQNRLLRPMNILMLEMMSMIHQQIQGGRPVTTQAKDLELR